MSNFHLISIVGPVGAGKSTIVKELSSRLHEIGLTAFSAGIDCVRKEVWEASGRRMWTWEDEDDAYAELFHRVTVARETYSVGILETSGLAGRMRHAHRRFAQFFPLTIVRVDCSVELCLERNRTRLRNASEYPVLPFADDLPESIVAMHSDMRKLRADLILSSVSDSPEKNAASIIASLHRRAVPSRPPFSLSNASPISYVEGVRAKARAKRKETAWLPR